MEMWWIDESLPPDDDIREYQLEFDRQVLPDASLIQRYRTYFGSKKTVTKLTYKASEHDRLKFWVEKNLDIFTTTGKSLPYFFSQGGSLLGRLISVEGSFETMILQFEYSDREAERFAASYGT